MELGSGISNMAAGAWRECRKLCRESGALTIKTSCREMESPVRLVLGGKLVRTAVGGFTCRSAPAANSFEFFGHGSRMSFF